MKNNNQIDLDVLRKVEELSDQINRFMAARARPFFKRYPLTFMLFIFIGAVAVSEGMKNILVNISFFADHPWRLLISGLVVLIVTGTLYRKLN